MSYLDEIAQKRKDMRTTQEAETKAANTHAESLSALTSGNRTIVEALEAIKAKPNDVTVSNDDLAKKTDIDSVIETLKELHLTNLLQAAKTPDRPMSITDSAAYVGDSIEKLGTQLMAKLDDDSSDQAIKVSLTNLSKSFETMQVSLKAVTANETKMQQAILKAIKDIEVNPMVDVKAPNVTVKAPNVDLKPLQTTLESYFAEDEDDSVDLDDYRAQDIRNNGDVQYVGFVNPTGEWYIIENQVKDNKLRYIFGKDNYEAAFEQAGSFEYSLMNEAINALSA